MCMYIYIYIQQQQSLSPKFFGVDDQVLKTFRINILEISPLDYTFLLFLTCTSNFVLIESKNHALCIILKYQKKKLEIKTFYRWNRYWSVIAMIFLQKFDR